MTNGNVGAWFKEQEKSSSFLLRSVSLSLCLCFSLPLLLPSSLSVSVSLFRLSVSVCLSVSVSPLVMVLFIYYLVSFPGAWKYFQGKYRPHGHQWPHPTARCSGHSCPSPPLPTPVPRPPTEQRRQWPLGEGGRVVGGVITRDLNPAQTLFSRHKFNKKTIKI